MGTVGNGNSLANTINGQANVETLSGLDGDDFVFGNGGADTISGGNGVDTVNGGDGVDTLRGGAGNDNLLGGLGTDILFGGANNDVFRYALRTETPNGASADRIRGEGGVAAFQGAGATVADVVNLAAVDANEVAAGNQTFVFGTAQTIGRLWAVNSGTNTLIRGSRVSERPHWADRGLPRRYTTNAAVSWQRQVL